MDLLRKSRKAETGGTQKISAEPFCAADGRGETCISAKVSSRRELLGAAMGGTLAGLVTVAGLEFATPRPAPAQSTLTPDAALQELMEGNRRFTDGRLTAHEQDLTI